MTISFSGQAPFAVELNGSTGRADIPAGQMRAIEAVDKNGARPAIKPRPAKDDEFGAVLAALLTVSGNQLQPNPVVEKTATAPNLTACETGACSVDPLPGYGPSGAVAGTGERQDAAISVYSSGDQQISSEVEEVSAGLVGANGIDAAPQVTTGLAADAEVNDGGLENRRQSSSALPSLLPAQVFQNRSKVDRTEGLEFTPQNPSQTESEIPASESSTYSSGSPAGHESLSQDAIDALDRIGQLTGEKPHEVVTTLVTGNGPTIRALSENKTTLSAEIDLLASPGSAGAVSVPELQLSAVTKIGLPKSPLPSAETDEESAALEETTPQETADSEPPVISPRSVAGRGQSANEERLLSAADALAELELNPGIAVRQESITFRSQYRDMEINAASGPAATTKLAADSVVRSSDTPAPVAAGSGAMPGDVAQLYVGNTFSEVVTPQLSDVRHTLSGQVSQAILQHIEHAGVRSSDSLTVRLDPPELGEMRIEISKTVEGLAVRVTALEALTMDMLLARGQEIETQLRDQQMDLKSLEFLRTDLSQNGFSKGQGQQQSHTSDRAANLHNQIRSGARNIGPAISNGSRNSTSDSMYGLSFRA